MQYLLNADEMKNCDKTTSEYFKIPSICLMERAALAAFEEIKSIISPDKKILIVCGSGNNGGDALAVARLLYIENYNVCVFFAGNKEHMTDQTKLQSEILEKYGLNPVTHIHNIDFCEYSCIIDGIFGIGLNRNISGNYTQIIEHINNRNSDSNLSVINKATIISLDIPSGINADNGRIMGCAVKADYTITFGFAKTGHFLYPGRENCGKLILKDIGITKHSLKDYIPQIYTYDEKDLYRILPKRKNDSNKGTFGKVTLFVGSKNMAGAAYLSAMAAYKAGAGYVRIVTPEENRVILQTLIPESVLTTYDSSNFGEEDFKEIIKTSSVILCGCGIGTYEYSLKLLEIILKNAASSLVLDADALNLISKNEYLYDYIPQDTIITPHLGEMSRLCNIPINKIKSNLLATAHDFVVKHSLCCVLKDSTTFVTMNGYNNYLNIHGCNGMSTAGSGDILAGIISGLLAAGMQIKDAADCGVLLHSLSGEEAALKYGNTSMTARDILEGISTTLNKIYKAYSEA